MHRRSRHWAARTLRRAHDGGGVADDAQQDAACAARVEEVEEPIMRDPVSRQTLRRTGPRRADGDHVSRSARRTSGSVAPCHIRAVYGIMAGRSRAMPRTAKIFMTNRSQAVRLPKDYQFATDEVFIR